MKGSDIFSCFACMNLHLCSISRSMILIQPSVKEAGVKIPWPECLELHSLSYAVVAIRCLYWSNKSVN